MPKTERAKGVTWERSWGMGFVHKQASTIDGRPSTAIASCGMLHLSGCVEIGEQSAIIGGEFDPGSGSTLAACLMHASRAG